ncbi:hypothetical protein [Azospirillum argentinense]|uniref:Uncharacterized protein n=1 Tax=Azospirillum argentinense TaxID=2970906 RepID=A0A5B0KJX7_9PROT|nr:hypothetical protein [Azospirillum argentinense]KAA1052957.1 hypothetical protein FH063_003364 [Azospirillum argentinense]
MARSFASDRFVTVALRGAQQAVQRQLVTTARAQIERVQQRANPSATAVYVDGCKGAPLDSVKPFGVVYAEFSYLAQVVEAALDLLSSTSPIETGAYGDSHAAYVDGERVAELSVIGEARRVVISNETPYARVIEVGIGSRVPWSKQQQVPAQGPYRAAVRALRRQFGHVAKIVFTFVALDVGTFIGDAPHGPKNRFPALILEAR